MRWPSTGSNSACDRHDELVCEAERQHRGGAHLIREIRPEPDCVRGDDRRRDGQDDGIRRQRAARGFDRKALSLTIDRRNGATEPNRQARRLRRDGRSISFDDAPVDAAVGVTVAVLAAPGGSRLVDCEPSPGGNAGPGIAIRRMQPAAAEIEWKRTIGHRMGPAASPVPRFKHGQGNSGRRKPQGGAKSGGARTDDNGLEIVPPPGSMRAPFELIPTCRRS